MSKKLIIFDIVKCRSEIKSNFFGRESIKKMGLRIAAILPQFLKSLAKPACPFSSEGVLRGWNSSQFKQP